jgi:hypothetical protein
MLNFAPTSQILLGCLMLSFLAACSSTPSATTESPSVAASAKPAAASASASHTPKAGGTVVESGGIHLEFVPSKEANQTHLDVFVQRSDSHAEIPTAQVSAQVQTPDGKNQTVAMKYDTADKHFFGIVPGTAKGQYQVKVTAIVDGKTIDGRFSFDR